MRLKMTTKRTNERTSCDVRMSFATTKRITRKTTEKKLWKFETSNWVYLAVVCSFICKYKRCTDAMMKKKNILRRDAHTLHIRQYSSKKKKKKIKKKKSSMQVWLSVLTFLPLVRSFGFFFLSFVAVFSSHCLFVDEISTYTHIARENVWRISQCDRGKTTKIKEERKKNVVARAIRARSERELHSTNSSSSSSVANVKCTFSLGFIQLHAHTRAHTLPPQTYTRVNSTRNTEMQFCFDVFFFFAFLHFFL